MSNPAMNKRKGAQWENDLKNGLRAAGEDIEHLHLTGTEDEGDLVIREPDGGYLVIEAKAGEKIALGPWLGEMEREAMHFARHRGLSEGVVDGVVIIKRRGLSWRKAAVVTTVERYFGLDAS